MRKSLVMLAILATLTVGLGVPRGASAITPGNCTAYNAGYVNFNNPCQFIARTNYVETLSLAAAYIIEVYYKGVRINRITCAPTNPQVCTLVSPGFWVPRFSVIKLQAGGGSFSGYDKGKRT